MARPKKILEGQKPEKNNVIAMPDYKRLHSELLAENDQLRRQLAQLIYENKILRNRLNQPEELPLAPDWILKDTIKKNESGGWVDLYPYQALDKRGLLVFLEGSTGKWMGYSRVVYQYFYGEIPTGHNIYHVDGNNRNYNPDNLIALTKEQFIQQSGICFDKKGKSIQYDRLDLETGEFLKEGEKGE